MLFRLYVCICLRVCMYLYVQKLRVCKYFMYTNFVCKYLCLRVCMCEYVDMSTHSHSGNAWASLYLSVLFQRVYLKRVFDACDGGAAAWHVCMSDMQTCSVTCIRLPPSDSITPWGSRPQRRRGPSRLQSSTTSCGGKGWRDMDCITCGWHHCDAMRCSVSRM